MFKEVDAFLIDIQDLLETLSGADVESVRLYINLQMLMCDAYDRLKECGEHCQNNIFHQFQKAEESTVEQKAIALTTKQAAIWATTDASRMVNALNSGILWGEIRDPADIKNWGMALNTVFSAFRKWKEDHPALYQTAISF